MGTSSVFGGGVNSEVYVALNLVFCFIASLASILTLMLIHKMNVHTGHVTLIFYMTIFQLAYDCTLFFSNVNCGYYITAFANFFQLFGGVSSSLISNWIAFIAYYIIIYRERFDIFSNFYPIMISACLPGFANGVFYLAVIIPQSAQKPHLINVALLDVYYYIRLGSIFLNFIFCGIAFYKVQLISSRKLATHKSVQETAIRTLALRMVYYPIVQAISRSGYAWYEKQYGADIDQIDANPTQYASLIFLTIITPSVSIGYLVIFLVMQPDAYYTFKAMVMCRDPRDSMEETRFVAANDRLQDHPEGDTSGEGTTSSETLPSNNAPPLIQAPPSELHRNHGSRPTSEKLVGDDSLSESPHFTTAADVEQGDASAVMNPLRSSALNYTGGRSTLGASMGAGSDASDATIQAVKIKKSRRKSTKRDMRDDEELIRIIADHEHLNRNTGMLDRMKSIVPFSSKGDSTRRSDLDRSMNDEDDEYYRTHMKGDSMVLPTGHKLSIFSRASTSSAYTDGANNNRTSSVRLKSLRWSQSSAPSTEDIGTGSSSISLPALGGQTSLELASDAFENQTL